MLAFRCLFRSGPDCLLPSRFCCTDDFKAVLDELDSSLVLYEGAKVIILGGLNADPGFPSPSVIGSPNEQGIILNKYLLKWEYASAFLYPRFRPSVSQQVFTYTSEAHGSTSCIDHLLCPGNWIKCIVQ